MQGARPVRAPRGTTLTAKSWATEAPLRMLMNNLDPENAERPDDLVVYGGTGRAARDWRSFDAMVRTLRTLEADETMLVQSGRPVGVMRTHEWAPRVFIANSNLVPDWANWPEFRRLESSGPHDVRADDRRILDLHRHPGHRAGHLRDVRRRGGEAVQRLPGRNAHPDRWLRRDGRRAAPGGHPQRRGLPHRRRRPEPTGPPGAASLPRRGGRGPRQRRGEGAAGQGGPHGVVGRRGGQLCRGVPRAAPPRRRDRHRHRPDQRTRSAVVPAGGHRARGLGGLRGEEAGGVHRPGPGFDGQARAGHGGVPRRRRRGLRLRQLDPRRGPAGRLRAGFRLPRLRARLHPAAVLRGQGSVPLGGAVGRPGRHRAPPTRPCWSCSPTTIGCRSGCAARRNGSLSRACRPGSAGSATASGTAPVWPSTTWSPPEGQRADRDRP